MALKGFEVKVEGTSPLLCSNVESSDPLGEGSKQKAFFHSKRKKNDEDHRALRTLDWIFSGYWKNHGKVAIDEDNNMVDFADFSAPTLPGANFQRCLRNAATKWKLGKDVLRSVVVSNDPEIEYDGPKDAIEMFNSRTPKYQKAAFTCRGVWVNRLMIPEWQVTYRLTVDDEILSVSQLKQIITMAGKAEGLGTWRPRHGRFTASEPVEVGFDA
tara:strand:+ start:537 stop:1178 length:642 start_codon:yes stop_codon:yes gene_type:complete